MIITDQRVNEGDTEVPRHTARSKKTESKSRRSRSSQDTYNSDRIGKVTSSVMSTTAKCFSYYDANARLQSPRFDRYESLRYKRFLTLFANFLCRQYQYSVLFLSSEKDSSSVQSEFFLFDGSFSM